MDGGGDVAVSVSSLLCSFVSHQSHDRNGGGGGIKGTLCKQIKHFSESRCRRRGCDVGALREDSHSH